MIRESVSTIFQKRQLFFLMKLSMSMGNIHLKLIISYSISNGLEQYASFFIILLLLLTSNTSQDKMMHLTMLIQNCQEW